MPSFNAVAWLRVIRRWFIASCKLGIRSCRLSTCRNISLVNCAIGNLGHGLSYANLKIVYFLRLHVNCMGRGGALAIIGNIVTLATRLKLRHLVKREFFTVVILTVIFIHFLSFNLISNNPNCQYPIFRPSFRCAAMLFLIGNHLKIS